MNDYAQLYFISPAVTTSSFVDGEGFELSPNARITVTGSVFVNSGPPTHGTKITNGDLLWESNTSANGTASATLSLRDGGQSFSQQATAGSDEVVVRPFTFVLESGDAPLDFSLLFAEELTARSPTTMTFLTPVPEPQSWALLLAGLVGLAARAKSRRRG